jgi:hypothetical protein
MATPGGPAKNINPTYSPEIHGWDFSWLKLLVAGYPPSSSHSSSSSQLKSQPCIFGEYAGLMFLVTVAAGVFGVAPVLAPNSGLTLAFSVQNPSNSAIYKKWKIVSNLNNFHGIS